MLSLTAKDAAALELHPATIQYATRSGAESRFWSKDRSQVSMLQRCPQCAIEGRLTDHRHHSHLHRNCESTLRLHLFDVRHTEAIDSHPCQAVMGTSPS